MSIGTDLALEAHDLLQGRGIKKGEIDGVLEKVEKNGQITVTTIEIINKKGEETLGKPQGRYVTIESPDLMYGLEDYEQACRKTAEILKEMIGAVKGKTILAVGLGNDKITPDALGPKAVSGIIVTKHLKENLNVVFGDSFSDVCAIVPGVLGNTGIEAAEVIKGVADIIKPDSIIAIDALAARSIDRINTTIQLSDAGIQPGAGVGNRRDALSEKSLGIPVIAVGVPTVAAAEAIARDALNFATKACEKEYEELLEKGFSKNISELIVTPKEIDLVTERAAKTVATSINMALHEGMTFEDIQGFMG